MPTVVLTSDPGVTLTYDERVSSRGGTYGRGGSTQRNEYWIRGSDQEEQIIEGVLLSDMVNDTPAGHVVDGFDYTPMEVDGDEWWYVTVYFREPNLRRLQAGEARLRWGIAGENVKIIRPKATISQHVPVGGTAITYEGIGDDGKDGFGGVDIRIPRLSFSFEFRVPAATLSTAYVAFCEAAVGKVNVSAWGPTGLSFATGEVLCTDITGAFEVGEDSTLTFDFAVSRSESGIAFGDVTGVSKEGWQYADVHSKNKLDGGVVKNVVSQVDILRLYDYFDFDLLGIPGAA